MNASHTATPAPVLFQLDVAPGNAEDFELWRWSVSPMFRMDAADVADRPTFAFTATSYHFADMAVATTRSSATRFERSREVIARHGIDSIIVQSYLTGGFRLTIDGRSSDVTSGDIVLLDMTQNVVIDGTDYTHSSMVLPRRPLLDLLPNVEQLHGTILRHGTPLNRLLLTHMTALHGVAPTLGSVDGRAAAQGSAALVAAAFGPTPTSREAVPKALAAATMQLLRQYIDDHLDDPRLGPDMLSQRFGVSRATLYRMFEELGGVRNYAHQRRLTRVYQLISNPKVSITRIGVIAQQFGFTSEAVFSRAFRRAYGLSPSDVREIAKAGALHSLAVRDNEKSSFWSMNRWLLGLDAQGR